MSIRALTNPDASAAKLNITVGTLNYTSLNPPISTTSFLSDITESVMTANHIVVATGTALQCRESAVVISGNNLLLPSGGALQENGFNVVGITDTGATMNFKRTGITDCQFTGRVSACNDSFNTLRAMIEYQTGSNRAAIAGIQTGVAFRDVQIGFDSNPLDLYLQTGKGLYIASTKVIDANGVNNANGFPSSSGTLAIRADAAPVSFNSNLNNITSAINSDKFAVFNNYTITKLAIVCSLNANSYSTVMDIYQNGALLVSSSPVTINTGTARYVFTFASTALSNSNIYYIAASATVGAGDTLTVENGFLSEA